MTQTIEIIITTEGKTTVQTLGFSGSSCREASRFLEEALGQRTSEQLTPPFYQRQDHRAHARQRQT